MTTRYSTSCDYRLGWPALTTAGFNCSMNWSWHCALLFDEMQIPIVPDHLQLPVTNKLLTPLWPLCRALVNRYSLPRSYLEHRISIIGLWYGLFHNMWARHWVIGVFASVNIYRVGDNIWIFYGYLLVATIFILYDTYINTTWNTFLPTPDKKLSNQKAKRIVTIRYLLLSYTMIFLIRFFLHTVLFWYWTNLFVIDVELVIKREELKMKRKPKLMYHLVIINCISL